MPHKVLKTNRFHQFLSITDSQIYLEMSSNNCSGDCSTSVLIRCESFPMVMMIDDDDDNDDEKTTVNKNNER